MRLPARLRWTTPFGQKIELSETMNVSRGGLLLSSREFHAAGAPIWVTFPYDASLPDGQPEMLGRVVRCITSHRDGHHMPVARDKILFEAPFTLAIHFDGLAQAASNGNRERREPEHRGSPRRLLAVPIRVRPEHIPWFEETMSLDFSPRG
ncbi:MAG TPA: PilZ domain-containing protein, partial [Candidatus Acidoferrum sp.]